MIYYMLVFIIIISCLVAGLEYRQLMKSKGLRDIVISASLLAAGLCLCVLQILDISMPSPLIGLQSLITPVNSFLAKLLK